MRRLRLTRATAGLAALSLAFGAGVALAATLGVTSARLTVSTYASSISASSCSLTAADNDGYVQQASAGSNFGTATAMNVTSAPSSANERSFVQFSLASCSIPANALVTAASLKLFMSTAPTATRTYQAHRVSASWGESTITWTNQPATAASATSSVATGTTANVTLTWNVAADVQAFADGTANNGWRIKDATESAATTRAAQFRTAEFGTASQRPILDVTYYP